MKNYLKELWKKYKEQSNEIQEIERQVLSSGVVIATMQRTASMMHPINTAVSVDMTSRMNVSLEDLAQLGKQGYMVKITNLSVEDKKWLKDQLDTDSVDLT